ncbi:unnamed protein product [Darwinula stevensoni]|uniref:SP-RING-type domain-containing protein n=1 Tax=Darwinula stevensoni TaxID=69355 RepID=A0A7R8XAG2_9CRUS|nr:unnamed protein product [Darwinula stevensoni]CAG0891866.1 unnamed protein product [Darwinula stevensoni]
MNARVEFSRWFLEEFDEGKSPKFRFVVTGDGAWFHKSDPETKQQSMRKTVTSHWHVDNCLPKVFDKLQGGRPKSILKKHFLRHDNAPAHRASKTLPFVGASGIQLIQPPPCDFWLFSGVKQPLRGKVFKTIDDVIEAVNTQLNRLRKEDFEQCFQSWIYRFKKCKDIGGKYAEHSVAGAFDVGEASCPGGWPRNYAEPTNGIVGSECPMKYGCFWIQDLVHSLRVIDLQKILPILGNSKLTKSYIPKAQLQAKIIHELQKPQSFHKVASALAAVREEAKAMGKDRMGRRPRKVNPDDPDLASPKLDPQQYTSGIGYHTSQPSSFMDPFMGVGGAPWAPLHPSTSSTPDPRMESHPSYNTLPQIDPSGMVRRPDIDMKTLHFFQKLEEIVKPTTLITTPYSKSQQQFIQFCLSPNEVNSIKNNYNPRRSKELIYLIQSVELVEMEPFYEWFYESILWLVTVETKSETELIHEVKAYKAGTRPGMTPKRPSCPLNITALCRLSPEVSNSGTVCWRNETNATYAFQINLVRRLTPAELFSQIWSHGISDPLITINLIKQKLRRDSSSDVCLDMTSLPASLNCPLNLRRLQYPCRAKDLCTHVQCFDALTYLEMNDLNPTWVCPLCKKVTPFDKLIIDGYFLQVLSQAGDSDDVVLNPDASWSLPNGSKKNVIEPMIRTTYDIPTLPSYLNEAVKGPPPDDAPSRSSGSSSGSGKSGKGDSVEVVDLVSDSDDDEREEAAATSSTKVEAEEKEDRSSSSGASSPIVISGPTSTFRRRVVLDDSSENESNPCSPEIIELD